MAVEVSGKDVGYRCGCGKILKSVQGWRGHMGNRFHLECAKPYTVVLNGPLPPAPQDEGTNVPPPAKDSPSEIESAPEEQESDPEEPAQEEQSTGQSAGGMAAAQDPPLGKPRKVHPSDFGAPKPSNVPERSVSFPVLARFSYDLYRLRFSQYQGSFAEFVYDMLETALWTIGLHPAGIWTEPMAPPPDSAVVPHRSPADVNALIEELNGAA